ncbi:MAG: fatty acid desaturase [bacterium]|nr:fatty acid desaturase [bacterium]MCP5066794.1 fatty acid desaturase [bacterium]
MRDPDWDELRRMLPARCLRPSTLHSLTYLLCDLLALAGVIALAEWVASPWLQPVLIFVEGTLFWALFVIGHDCGHGSFSRRAGVNTWVGHLVHTPLLVPFHAWRISHRRHHRHVGDLDRDEGWFPYTSEQIHAMPWWLRLLRFQVPLVAFPAYLMRGTPGRAGNHLSPGSALFEAHEQRSVRVSLWACAVWLGLLLMAAVSMGPGAVVRHFVAPYLVFVVWVDLVTYLHHQGPGVPWYRGSAWTPVRGALATIDRSYGIFDRIHHHAGWHTAHHLFSGIPHYRLVEATQVLNPHLPDYQRDTMSVGSAVVWALQHPSVPARGDRVELSRLR